YRKVVVAFPVRGPEIPEVRIALAGERHGARGEFGVQAALVKAEGDLDQAIIRDDLGKRPTESPADALHGLARPAQRRHIPVELVGPPIVAAEQLAKQPPVAVGLTAP